MVAPIIVHNRFTPGRIVGEDERARELRIGTALRQATDYLLHSDRHGLNEPRTLFDRRTDGLELADVRARLMAQRGERAAFHRLTLSLHPSLDLVSEPDVQRWTRAVLASGSAWLGATGAEWVAATHRDTGVLHVHAVLAGGDAAGRDLVLRPPFFAQVRAAGMQEVQRIQAERATRLQRLHRFSLAPRSWSGGRQE
jgi:hypothetical protein